MAVKKTRIITRRAGERDGILFWILPPLLLGAVFAFCAMNSVEPGDEPQGTEQTEEE